MCGIAGFTGDRNSPALKAMLDSQRHRGPDGQGAFDGGPIHLAHTRLSIIDLRGGQQPMWNEDHSCAVVFNGEIYNYRELRRDLEDRHHFVTASDTEVLLHLYEEKGLDLPRWLDGDFAFCLWDLRQEHCFFCRDALGVKPLYYSLTPAGNLIFASELRTLLKHPDLHAELDPAALVEYLTCLAVAAPRSFLRGVRKLQSGEALLWKEGQVRSWFWWQPPRVEEAAPPSAIFQERIHGLLEGAVRKRLIADVPVGAFLSGGLDSGVLVALAARQVPGIQTFSIGFGEPDFDELQPARLVSRHCGTQHREFVIRPEAQELLQEVIRAMDEPIADSSAIPTYLVSRETRQTVKAALSGIGGDEMFGGYPRYLGARLGSAIPPWAGKLLARGSDWFPSRPVARDVGGWLRRFTRGLGEDPAMRYWNWTTFLDNDRRLKLLKNGPQGRLPFEAEALVALESGGGEFLDRIFRWDLSRYLSADLLKFADNMSMAHSLEVRVPYCDIRLVEEMARTTASVRHPGLRLKPVLRAIAARYLPPEIVRRKKQGFMIPIGRWFRNDLRGFLQRELDGSNLPSLFAGDAVQTLIREHVEGRFNHTHLLWAVLVLKRWLAEHPEIHLPDPGAGGRA